ncbi:hypothetical protein P280DRAFT_509600 [Massarina eburnea CBS 473.64]|uniref:Uncharacterized protein n=1 Tax=Massarina eburnea CBS 473.64 TaxID=1395130 RepID=A0A6A6RPP9_9PLEO|nr:hypothetical protein P280DRAFT_509600 [Massarina eburnea CBS 473.64]
MAGASSASSASSAIQCRRRWSHATPPAISSQRYPVHIQCSLPTTLITCGPAPPALGAQTPCCTLPDPSGADAAHSDSMPAEPPQVSPVIVATCWPRCLLRVGTTVQRLLQRECSRHHGSLQHRRAIAASASPLRLARCEQSSASPLPGQASFPGRHRRPETARDADETLTSMAYVESGPGAHAPPPVCRADACLWWSNFDMYSISVGVEGTIIMLAPHVDEVDGPLQRLGAAVEDRVYGHGRRRQVAVA